MGPGSAEQREERCTASGTRCSSLTAAMVIGLRNGRVNRISRFRNNARETSAFCDFTVIHAANAFTPRSSRYLNYPSNFIGHGHPNKPANGERMIRQGVGGLAIGSGAFQ
jgi:hypothetical protein